MSVQAMAWAIKRARVGDLSASQNHLLLVLANYADQEGCDAFPGAATLAADTGMTVRGVRNILQQLEGLGVIQRGNQAITAAKNYPYGQRPTVWNLSMLQMELVLEGAGTREPRSPPPGTTFTPEPRSPVNQTTGTREPGSHDPSITINPSLRSGFGARAAGDADDKPRRGGTTGTRLPAGWQPDDDDLRFAAENGVDGRVEAAKFRDYWHAVAGAKGRKQDWDATWRNWIRRAAEDLNRYPSPRSHAHESPRRSLAEHAADSHRRADERDRRAGSR